MGRRGRSGAAGHHGRARGHDPARAGAGRRGGLMKVVVAGKPLAEVAADALVVGLYAEEKRRDVVNRLDAGAQGLIGEVLDAEKFQAKTGHVTHVHTSGRLKAKRVIVVGLGKRAELTAELIRRASAAGVRRARDLGARTVATEVLGDRLPARQRAHAVTEGAILGAYVFDRYKREKADKRVEQLRSEEHTSELQSPRNLV